MCNHHSLQIATHLYFQQDFYAIITIISCRCYWYIAFNNCHIFLYLLQEKHLYFWQGIPVMATNIPCIYFTGILLGIIDIFFPAVFTCKMPVFLTGLVCNSYHYFLKMLQVYCLNNWHIFLQLLQAKHLHFWQGIPVMATNIPCICYWYISLKNWHIFL